MARKKIKVLSVERTPPVLGLTRKNINPQIGSNKMGLKRYELTRNSAMTEDPAGEWIRWEDLLKECQGSITPTLQEIQDIANKLRKQAQELRFRSKELFEEAVLKEKEADKLLKGE